MKVKGLYFMCRKGSWIFFLLFLFSQFLMNCWLSEVFTFVADFLFQDSQSFFKMVNSVWFVVLCLHIVFTFLPWISFYTNFLILAFRIDQSQNHWLDVIYLSLSSKIFLILNYMNFILDLPCFHRNVQTSLILVEFRPLWQFLVIFLLTT